MSISGQYPSPEIVNGYVCWDCADVAKAKKDINPNSSSLDLSSSANGSSQSPAVVFGGALAGANSATGQSSPGASSSGQPNGANPQPPTAQTSASLWAPGNQLNITA
jgi:hypothetical protein